MRHECLRVFGPLSVRWCMQRVMRQGSKHPEVLIAVDYTILIHVNLIETRPTPGI